MIAADRVVDAAFQRLSGDSTLSALVGARIGREPIIPVAVGLAGFPYVSLGIQANTPLMTTNGTRVWENTVLRVSAWVTAGQGHGVMRSITDRVDTLLQGYGAVSTGGAYVVRYRLLDTTDLVEDDVDGQRLHRVMLYRCEAHES